MAKVRVLSTTMIQATTEKETVQRIELTQCDLKLLLIDAIQKGLLFLKPKPSEEQKLDQTLLIQHLKKSLSRTLDFFTPLAGRLATVEHDDATVSYFIDCNNAGAQFVHAVADDVTIAEILEPVYVPLIVHSLFPLNGVKNYDGISEPLLAVQITELVDGIFIGFSMNHSVVDGASFWNFFNSWSEIHRGVDHISEPPILERRLLLNYCNNFQPIRLPLAIIKNCSVTHTPLPLKERVFHFSMESIARLKAKANAQVATTSISSLQSLSAHIWRSTTRNQQVDPDKEVNLMIWIGLQTRLQPPLPAQYFGNGILLGAVTMKAREILDHELGYTALQINKVVSSYTDDKVKCILHSLQENPSPIVRSKVERNHSLAVTSSPRFNVYDTDFGWGRPVAVRSGAGNKYDGKITLYPGMKEGSMDIEVCVFPETLNGMENDLEFMDAVTI